MHFSGDLILRTHMRMSGSWHIYRPGERWLRPSGDMRVMVGTESFVAVAFKVPVAVFETERTIERNEALGSLAPICCRTSSIVARDPQAAARARTGIQPINECCSTSAHGRHRQRLRSETLFATGINPFKMVCELTTTGCASW